MIIKLFILMSFLLQPLNSLVRPDSTLSVYSEQHYRSSFLRLMEAGKTSFTREGQQAIERQIIMTSRHRHTVLLDGVTAGIIPMGFLAREACHLYKKGIMHLTEKDIEQRRVAPPESLKKWQNSVPVRTWWLQEESIPIQVE